MNELDTLLRENWLPLRRYVCYKINNLHDAEDVIQEVCLTATVKFDTLKDRTAFKPWLISIANRKCADYFRQKAKCLQISLDSLSDSVLSTGRFGLSEQSIVRETLDALGDKEKQILYLHFFKNLSQKDIAAQLSVPIGTVKSRLHYAKEKFKQNYPHQNMSKGETIMKLFPDFLPEYKIEKMTEDPFAVVHEELPGMFIIPRIGEKISFAMYDFPSGKQNGIYHLNVTGKINLHGVDGVAIHKHYREIAVSEENTVFAQLTDTHCKYLGGISCDESGNQKITTFLDNDFDIYYGIGENNCGFPTHRKAERKIIQTSEGLSMSTENDVSDIVGRYKIFLNNNTYETVRLIDYQNGDSGGMLCEYYIDGNGRTVLWRRFNKNDWANGRYGKLWTELLPENETLLINGEVYVHWYDCVSDYIF